ncbi:histidine phosphatase family protein [Paenibacillus yanchengensis]|uniref:Histidine phosphatase family protein n=1 Tax=Paenibacillus yanchengensis TaxID=2035833 RepID=A0ABW4YJN9_9BACL
MKLGFVRHGETDWNRQGILQGQTDIPLNETGVLQARQLAERLAQEEAIWDAIIASPLQRAYDTAAIISDKLNIPLLTADTRLQERGFGLVEGTNAEQRVARFGKDWRDNAVKIGMESDEQIWDRFQSFLAELQQEEQPGNLLIVSHGSFLGAVLHLLCTNLEEERIDNLSYSIFQWDSSQWSPLLYNCTRHLNKL